jgi:uronate dehydrogenase
VRRSIDAPAFHFIVVYGVSANTRNQWHDKTAQRIGYQPEDNAEAFAAQLETKTYPPGPATEFHGGDPCAMEFSGELPKID